MSIQLLFWVIMVVGFVFGFYNNREQPMGWLGNSLVIWVLLALLGWQVFGAAVHK